MEAKILALIAILTVTHAQTFNPTLTVDSCTQSKLKLTLTDGASGGIIYIQGQGASCKQTTSTGTATHEFDFSSCGIAWASSFKMIVQRKALYQTGDDKQIPIMCIADLSDITVDNNLNALDKDDDASQNLTVRPTATMKLYRSGVDVSGSSVQLTDVLTMSVELDVDYLSDFDIKATACTASTISVIENSCSTDIDLFPNFAKPAQGYLSSAFGAFRTTDLNGGSVAMTFSCTLTVCQGACAPESCASGDNGYGRKKRAISKRQADNTAFDDISVGTTIRIAAEELVLETPDDDGDVCMDKDAFVIALLALLFALVACAVTAVFMTRRMKQNATALKKLNGGMTSVSMG